MRIVVAVFMLVGMTSAARAQDGPPGVAPYVDPVPYAYPAPPTREVSYAATTLVLDAAAIGMIGLAVVRTDGDGLGLVSLGMSTYLLGAPIAHAAHGQLSSAFASIGLRAGLPILGAIAGARIGPRDQVDCVADAACDDSTSSSTAGIVLGAGAGVLAAIVLDSGFLARKRVVDRAPYFVPTTAVTPYGFSIGVGGAF